MNIFENWGNITKTDFQDNIYNLLVEQGNNLIQINSMFSYCIDKKENRISLGGDANENIYRFFLKKSENEETLWLFDITAKFDYWGKCSYSISHENNSGVIVTENITDNILIEVYLKSFLTNDYFLKKIQKFYYFEPQTKKGINYLNVLEDFIFDGYSGDGGNCLVISKGNMQYYPDYFDGVKYSIKLIPLGKGNMSGNNIYKIDNIEKYDENGQFVNVKFIDFLELEDYDYYLYDRFEDGVGGFKYGELHKSKNKPTKVVTLNFG
jgi:hypothetical protein